MQKNLLRIKSPIELKDNSNVIQKYKSSSNYACQYIAVNHDLKTALRK